MGRSGIHSICKCLILPVVNCFVSPIVTLHLLFKTQCGLLLLFTAFYFLCLREKPAGAMLGPRQHQPMSSDDLLTSALDDPDFDEVTAAGKIKICCIHFVFTDVLFNNVCLYAN
jgi:hypothetical protein